MIVFQYMELEPNTAMVDAFTRVCKSFQLSAGFVLECFAGALSVEVSLFATGELQGLAATVLKLFLKHNGEDLLPLHPVKREQSIHYLRQMLKLYYSSISGREKSRRQKRIMNSWLAATGMEDNKVLILHGGLAVTITSCYLLLCDVLRRSPECLSHFFMRLVVKDAATIRLDGPGIKVLFYIANGIYPAVNN